jgi:hypothetical protein
MGEAKFICWIAMLASGMAREDDRIE